MINASKFFYDYALIHNMPLSDKVFTVPERDIFISEEKKKSSKVMFIDDELQEEYVMSIPEEQRKTVNPGDEKIALEIIRYALEYYLEWTPAFAMENLTEEILTRIGLYHVAMTRINYPLELKELDSPRPYYIVCKLYPDMYTYNMRDAVTAYYEKKILRGGGYTKKLFNPDTDEGRERAFICFIYAMNKESWIYTLEKKDLYRFFSGDSKGFPMGVTEFLLKYKLAPFVRNAYSGNSLDFLHCALPEKERSTLWYRWYTFNREKKRAKNGLC